MDPPGPLVSPEWLAARLSQPALRVVDVRWYLDGRSGYEAYLSGHIAGAVFSDLDRELSAEPGAGRHPLPSADRFAAAMRRAGIGSRTLVVAYDDAGGSIAGRLWWLLRFHGHPRVAVLDGGLQAWEGPVEAGPVAATAGDFVAQPGDRSQFVDFAQLSTGRDELVLLDARAPRRYSGEEILVDPVPGHIPGAVSAFWQENLGPDGRFLPPDQLRARYSALGVRGGPEAVVYCGSGVTSCHDLLALALAGFEGARLYPGSWSDWSSHEGAAAATGSQPASEPGGGGSGAGVGRLP